MNKLIEQLGWVDQNDRGMSENYGYLFKKGDYELRYWKTHPRINLIQHGDVYGPDGDFRGDCTRLFDSGIISEGIGIDDIKQVMVKFNIPML